MLFQGQEFAASAPFFYFADHNPELRKLVREGRFEFLSQFPGLSQSEMRPYLSDPGDESTFERSKLDLGERQTHSAEYSLYRDLIRLRREDPVFRSPQPRAVDGAVLGPEAFVLRFFERPGAIAGQDRLLLINLGRDFVLDPAPDPLLAPPEGSSWKIQWSSEEPRYGGSGTAPLDESAAWMIPGHSALVMTPCLS
jgi:maltooligosyltrehalose trehalohydrolase